jgi:hypothetical protein
VFVSFGNFTKTGGTIYGIKKEDAITAEDANLQNTASTFGRAVSSGSKWRDSTAGPTVILKSTDPDSLPPWGL